MTKSILNPKVDAFLERTKNWQEEFIKLREIVLACGLTEEVKWGQPCYMFEKDNIILIQGFKEYCAVLFFKGALLKDPNGVLFQQTENMQSARQIRFTNSEQIIELAPIIQAYIYEAIENEKDGLKVTMKKVEEYDVTAEFQEQLDEMPELKTAFEALTPGRQRGYLRYFAEPKQSKTRTARVEKNIQNILNGKGLNE